MSVASSIAITPATRPDLYHMVRTCEEAKHITLGSVEALLTPQTLALWVDGEMLAVGGILSMSPGLGIAWCFCKSPPSQHRTRVLYRLRQGWRQLLAQQPYRRIETLVLRDFLAAHWLAQWLGFMYCCTKPLLGPKGETFVEYVYYPEAP